MFGPDGALQLGVLTKCERRVLDALGNGQPATLGKSVPLIPNVRTNKIRADLVRFLACGGDEKTPMPVSGIEIHGAYIEGKLDFVNRVLPANVTLKNCHLPSAIDLKDASTRSIDLYGSRCGGIDADGAKISGALKLNEGFVATKAVTLTRATIGGDFEATGGFFDGVDADGCCLECSGMVVGGLVLWNKRFVAKGAVRILSAILGSSLNCSEGRFAGQDTAGNALLCDRTTVGGNVLLSDGFVAQGAVRFVGATIKDSVDCDSGRIEGWDDDGDALVCDRAKIEGNVFMRDGFISTGVIRLVGCTVGRSIFCQGGIFGAMTNGRAPAPGPERWMALNLTDSTAKVLWLAASPPTAQKAMPAPTFHGGLNLTNANIGLLADMVTAETGRRAIDATPAGAGPAPSEMVLDGFVFNRFDKQTDLGKDARIAFLKLQRPPDHGAEFKPQPWVQMIKVLRDMGNDEEAREAAVQRQRARREAGVIPGLAGRLHDLYGALYGYGYRPMWLAAWAAGFALICAWFFWLAEINGVMAPTDQTVLQDSRYAHCHAELPVHWTECNELKFRYTVFNPLLYSLELVVPIVGTRQAKDWAPITVVPCVDVDLFGICRRFAALPNRAAKIQPTPGYWLGGIAIASLAFIENLFGWLAGLMFVAVASGLIKKD